MKTIYRIALGVSFMALPALGMAQTPIANSGGDNNETGLIEEVFKIKEKQDKFHLYLNTQANFDLDWDGVHGDEFEGGKFAFRQLRIEFKGRINDWLTYRYRQRLTQNKFGDFDNIMKSIDIAEVGFQVDKVNIVAGKQCTAYGGIEFDLNPIEVYQYCDMIDYMDNFMTGVRAAWDINPAQQLQFQILNSTALNPGDMYGTNFEKAKLPLLYTANWNGSFGQDFFKTRWSASIMNEIKNKHMYYLAFGNQFNFSPQCGAWLDVMYSREGIDRKGIITNVVGTQNGHNAFNTEYLTLLLHANYFFHPKWNVFAKVAWERNGVYKESKPTGGSLGVEKGNYGTDWLYVGGVEYYPLKDRGLHFFLTYIGQNTRHSEMAQKMYSAVPSSFTNRLTCGFIWQVPIF